MIRKQTSCFRSPLGKDEGERRERERKGFRDGETHLEREKYTGRKRVDGGERKSSTVEFGNAKETALSAFP